MRNEKMEVEILGYEEKTSPKNGKNYCVFKTNCGAMTSFEGKITDMLKFLKRAEVFVAIDDEKGFMNIRSASPARGESAVKAIMPVSQNTLKTALFEGDTKKNITMYVSYAKDIFIQLLENTTTVGEIEADKIMEKAVELVKQARTAFEKADDNNAKEDKKEK